MAINTEIVPIDQTSWRDVNGNFLITKDNSGKLRISMTKENESLTLNELARIDKYFKIGTVTETQTNADAPATLENMGSYADFKTAFESGLE